MGRCGIASFADSDNVCELQKMYLSSKIRGTGAATELLQVALDFAKLHYKKCYLETLQNMHAANRFYTKYGFELLDAPLTKDAPHWCWSIVELNYYQ